MIMLHLGCGTVHLPGFQNIDIRKTDATDLVMDVRKLTAFEDNSIDLIYACHILDHFSKHEIDAVLTEWRRVLKPDRTLRLAVSDFEKVVWMYQHGTKLERLWGLLVGGQKNKYDQHGCLFDFNTLKKYLVNNEFYDVKRYDWRYTSHSRFDDYSRAYLPDFDFENGTLMSLNVEAKKYVDRSKR